MAANSANRVVGLSMRVTTASGYTELRDAISHDWIRLLDSWEMTSLLIPNTLTDPAAFVEACGVDLLVLTGGDDIGVSAVRDAAEKIILDHALERGIPILGVCRGLQFIVQYFGGQLSNVDGHVGSNHPCKLSDRWGQIYSAQEIQVNSFHGKAVTPQGLAPNLRAEAWDSSGRIEAVQHRRAPVAGVMWHPERDGAPTGDRNLFETLLRRGK